MKFANTEIRTALDHVPDLPTPVSDRIVETGADSTDDPAVWVWAAVLPDDKTDIRTRIAIRDIVFDHIRERSETPVYVYVSFRTAAEMEDAA